jgi:hypothetical protein
MSTALQDLEFELGGVVFGGDETTIYPVSRFEGLGSAPLRTVEYENPREDGRSFGREYRGGRELTIEGGVKTPGDAVAAWEGQGALAEVFDGAASRGETRTVQPLRFRRPGKPTRVVYGRPDKFDPDVTQAVIGWVPWSATFRCSDPNYYDDTEQVVVMSTITTTRGHIITGPGGVLTSPIRTVAETFRSSTVENAGDTPTWPVVTVRGPVADPSVALVGDDGQLRLNGSVAYDEEFVIDTRPWSRGASLNDGPIRGTLSTDSVPSRSTIPPGVYDLTVGGIDLTGTAEFEIRWRNAYRKI